METETKKGNRKYIIIIVLLAFALIGTGGYLLYDKVIHQDMEKQEEKEKEEKEEVQQEETVEKKDGYINFDTTTVEKQLNDNLSQFTTFFRPVADFGEDLLANSWLRGFLVTTLYSWPQMSGENSTNPPDLKVYHDGIRNDFLYIPKETFAAKYLEVYGKEGLMEQDQTDGKAFYDCSSELVGEGYITWDAVSGVNTYFNLYPNTIYYHANEDQYELVGTYQIYNSDQVLQNIGKFTLKYNEDKTKQKHLISYVVDAPLT